MTVTSRNRWPDGRDAASARGDDAPACRGIANSYDLSGRERDPRTPHSASRPARTRWTERIGGVRLPRLGRLVLPSQRRDRREESSPTSTPLLDRPPTSWISTAAPARLRCFSHALGATVYGVEENPHAVAEARSNARLNGAGASGAVPGRARRGCARCRAGARGAERRGRGFLDPPRKGSDEATLGAIAEAARSAHLVSLVRPRDAGPGFEVPCGQGLPARRSCSRSTCSRKRGTSRRWRRSCESNDRSRSWHPIRSTSATSPQLARLALTDEEVERFGAQLGDLLEHVDALAEAGHRRGRGDRASRRVAQRRARRRRRARASIARSCSQQAPQRQGGFFRVPRIIAGVARPCRRNRSNAARRAIAGDVRARELSAAEVTEATLAHVDAVERGRRRLPDGARGRRARARAPASTRASRRASRCRWRAFRSRSKTTCV